MSDSVLELLELRTSKIKRNSTRIGSNSRKVSWFLKNQKENILNEAFDQDSDKGLDQESDPNSDQELDQESDKKSD